MCGLQLLFDVFQVVCQLQELGLIVVRSYLWNLSCILYKYKEGICVISGYLQLLEEISFEVKHAQDGEYESEEFLVVVFENLRVIPFHVGNISQQVYLVIVDYGLPNYLQIMQLIGDEQMLRCVDGVFEFESGYSSHQIKKEAIICQITEILYSIRLCIAVTPFNQALLNYLRDLSIL